MRVAYFYLMKAEPERVRAIAPRHASYWQELALRDYRGGPFRDRSGGLIVFDSESEEHAERLVSWDPFFREGLLEQHWIKAWLADPPESGETAALHGSGASDEERMLAIPAGRAQTTAAEPPRKRAEQ